MKYWHFNKLFFQREIYDTLGQKHLGSAFSQQGKFVLPGFYEMSAFSFFWITAPDLKGHQT